MKEQLQSGAFLAFEALRKFRAKITERLKPKKMAGLLLVRAERLTMFLEIIQKTE